MIVIGGCHMLSVAGGELGDKGKRHRGTLWVDVADEERGEGSKGSGFSSDTIEELWSGDFS